MAPLRARHGSLLRNIEWLRLGRTAGDYLRVGTHEIIFEADTPARLGEHGTAAGAPRVAASQHRVAAARTNGRRLPESWHARDHLRGRHACAPWRAWHRCGRATGRCFATSSGCGSDERPETT